jgi:hypothetical protein
MTADNIESDSLISEPKESEKANVGLIIGIMVVLIVLLVGSVYVLYNRNKTLKLEARGRYTSFSPIIFEKSFF